MTKQHEKLVDEGTFIERDADLASVDPLDYPDYRAGLETARKRTGSAESVITGSAKIGGYDVEIASFDFEFFGGSMGEATGERLARGLERAAAEGRPFVLRTSTGGARMQEGMRSLVQMPKVVAARITLGRSGSPFIAILGHPTTGGVLASLAALADITFAGEGATVGFAGPRVAEAFTGLAPGDGSHTASSALDNGLVDAVIRPDEERAAVINALAILAPDAPVDVTPPEQASQPQDADVWETVRAARGRLNPAAALVDLCDDLIELRGDKGGSDDRALRTVVARVAGRRCALLALDRERPPAAAAFRKAHRVIDIAARLRLPIVTLIDTRGADPSEDSEASGVAWAIARTFEALLSAPVPVVSIVTGEGGSGGALAFGAGDVLVAYQHAFFSVIGPEGAAQILWRDSDRAPEAARLLKVSAHDLQRLGIADHVVAEPVDPESLRGVVAYHLDRVAGDGSSESRLADKRQRRWRSL